MQTPAKVKVYEAFDRIVTKPITDPNATHTPDDLALQIEVAAVLISELDRKAAKRGKRRLEAARQAESDAKSGAKALGRLAEGWRKLEEKWETLAAGEPPSQEDIDALSQKLDAAQNGVNDARQTLGDCLRRWLDADPRHSTRARVQGYIEKLSTAGAWTWED